MFIVLTAIFVFTVLPILIKFNVIPNKMRLGLLGVVFGLSCIAGIAMFCGLLLLSVIMGTKKSFSWWKDPHFLFLFIPISIVQQFLYQAFLFQRLHATFGVAVAITMTALLFGLVHIIFPRPFFNFIVTSAAGLLFCTLYLFYPNLFLASILHMFLNFTAVYLGFFTLLTPQNTPLPTRLSWKR